MLYAPPRARRRRRCSGAHPGCCARSCRASTALEPTHLLSNGRYSVALRANGAGWSRWGRLRHHALARRCAARRPRQLLLPALGPAAAAGLDHPAPRARPGRALPEHLPRRPRVLRRGLARAAGALTVWVSPEDDIEFRQVELRNLSDRTLDIELMSAFEVTLADPRADEAHPAFIEPLRARRVAGRAAGAGVRAQAAPAHRTGPAGRAFPGRHRPAGGRRARTRPTASAGWAATAMPASRWPLSTPCRRRRPMRRALRHRARPGLRAVGAPSHRAQRKGAADLRHRGVRQRRHLARRDRQVPATQPRSTRLADVGHADRHPPARHAHQPGELRGRPDADHGAGADA